MRLRYKAHWLMVAAIIAAMANVFAVAAPSSVQAAPGSLLDALKVICSPDGEARPGQHDGSSHTGHVGSVCDHCALCPGSLVSLPLVAPSVPAPRPVVMVVAAAAGHDGPVVDTISHRPSGRGPPAVLR